MIKHMFVFGVLIPAVITIIVFLGFLICWYKLSINKKLLKKKRKHRDKGAFSALTVNSTQRIIQYGHDEEEYDNEKNLEFDNQIGFSRLRDGPTINIISPSSSNNIGCTGLENCTRYQHERKGNTYTREPGYLSKICTSRSNTDITDSPAPKYTPEGVVNHSLCLSPSMEVSGQREGQIEEQFVQHTFHFGNPGNCDESLNLDQMSNNRNDFSSDSEEDEGELENYVHSSHFVPIQEVCPRDTRTVNPEDET